jgi:hypothetical protein
MQRKETTYSVPNLNLKLTVFSPLKVLKMAHDPKSELACILRCTVVEARNLPVADIGGSSDPYVLFKDTKGIKMSGKGVKTKTIKKFVEF